MEKSSIKDRCIINICSDEDSFVGIKSQKEGLFIHFPLGFRLETDEKKLRRDILLLLNVITRNTDKKESFIERSEGFVSTAFPVHAYLFVLADFFARGYYKETASVNVVGHRGKINWSRTLKTHKPYIGADGFYYLDYEVRKQNAKENELITLVHEYCVYESFNKLGWLFTSYIPPRPKLKENRKLFSGIVKKKMAETFNDYNKQSQLFIGLEMQSVIGEKTQEQKRMKR